jgi:hypothetical protein
MSELYCLVEQEIPRLRRYARALTRASDRADDLVQDTLLRALTKLHLWQPRTYCSFGVEHEATRSSGRHRLSVGRLRLGLAPSARPLEPVEGWMGSPALRA